VSPATPAGENPDRVRPTRTFRRRSDLPKLSADQVRRQNDVLQSAWRHFKTPGPVIAFLNARNEQLQGKPLQIALSSDEGLLRVERLLGEMPLQA
jgi:hypothetical protein